ncbi:MAG: ABC transporter substrate-binding protein [Alphaproteobacteria bacterium]|nr:ABC transporter substrate-binding protein [Alphaproteobacteria bacterium]
MLKLALVCSRRALITALLVTGLGHAVSAQPLVKLDLAASNTYWGQAPLMAAIDKGYFREQGIEVELKHIPTSMDRIAALNAGSVAFSNLGRVAVISEMARNNQSFYYFANIDDSPGNEGCWARPGFSKFADLRGKKVAANTSAQITMNGLLANESMTEKDIQFVNLPFEQMSVALANGDVDAACVWEPFFSGLKKAVPNGNLLGLDSDTPTFKKFGTMASPDVMIISRKLVDEKPDLARKLVTAIFKGVDYLNANPEEAAKLIAPRYRKSPEDVLVGIKSFTFFGTENWRKHIQLHTGQMQFQAQWMFDNGKIPALPDVTKWENVSFIP